MDVRRPSPCHRPPSSPFRRAARIAGQDKRAESLAAPSDKPACRPGGACLGASACQGRRRRASCRSLGASLALGPSALADAGVHRLKEWKRNGIVRRRGQQQQQRSREAEEKVAAPLRQAAEKKQTRRRRRRQDARHARRRPRRSARAEVQIERQSGCAHVACYSSVLRREVAGRREADQSRGCYSGVVHC